MITDFFTAKELESITGRTTPAAQARHLEKMGLKVFRNAMGKVILSREAFIRCQMGFSATLDPAGKEPKLRPIK